MWRGHLSLIMIAAKLCWGIDPKESGKDLVMTKSFYSSLTLITAADDQMSFWNPASHWPLTRIMTAKEPRSKHQGDGYKFFIRHKHWGFNWIK